MRYLDDIGRLVALSAAALRRKKRRVGFGENAVEGQLPGHIADGLRLRIGDISGERNHESHVEAATGFVDRSGEAVKNSAKTCRAPVLLDNFQTIRPRVAAVNDDGEFGGTGLLKLAAEDALLQVRSNVIVVIIETHFAPGNDSRIRGERIERGVGFVGDVVHIVRMDADGGVDPIVLLGKWNCGIKAVDARAAANGEEALDARPASPEEHGVAVFVKLRKFQVRMRIDNFQRDLSSGRQNCVPMVAAKMNLRGSIPLSSKLAPMACFEQLRSGFDRKALSSEKSGWKVISDAELWVAAWRKAASGGVLWRLVRNPGHESLVGFLDGTFLFRLFITWSG